MQGLHKAEKDDPLFMAFFMHQLPQAARAILAVQEFDDVIKLAQAADDVLAEHANMAASDINKMWTNPNTKSSSHESTEKRGSSLDSAGSTGSLGKTAGIAYSLAPAKRLVGFLTRATSNAVDDPSWSRTAVVRHPLLLGLGHQEDPGDPWDLCLPFHLGRLFLHKDPLHHQSHQRHPFHLSREDLVAPEIQLVLTIHPHRPLQNLHLRQNLHIRQNPHRHLNPQDPQELQWGQVVQWVKDPLHHQSHQRHPFHLSREDLVAPEIQRSEVSLGAKWSFSSHKPRASKRSGIATWARITWRPWRTNRTLWSLGAVICVYSIFARGSITAWGTLITGFSRWAQWACESRSARDSRQSVCSCQTIHAIHSWDSRVTYWSLFSLVSHCTWQPWGNRSPSAIPPMIEKKWDWTSTDHDFLRERAPILPFWGTLWNSGKDATMSSILKQDEKFIRLNWACRSRGQGLGHL
ncbi:hypothetical protein TCAL_16586 [Tigriopus californicus]|uniref:Uncharacterized protein n=1 Tax=Tigriopus californicus TaxID=6832 RepID=A0A553NDV8_TIGCA|nr:hypothetical protein TCAL_16586 [Tigriopus californicus]